LFRRDRPGPGGYAAHAIEILTTPGSRLSPRRFRAPYPEGVLNLRWSLRWK
jgi:hypothetical protein